VLDECEINELVFPISGRLARVALRVERKVEPLPEPPPAEERKAVRRTRPSDAPVVEETDAHDATPPPALEESVPATKAKPRPRRSKAKSAEPIAQAPIEVVALETDPVDTQTLTEMVTTPPDDPIISTPDAEPAQVEALAASVESTAPIATTPAQAEPVDVPSRDATPIDATSHDAEHVPNAEPTGAGVRAKAAPASSSTPTKTSARSAAKKTAKPAAKSSKKAAPAVKKTATVSAAKKTSAVKKAAPKKATAKKTPAKKAAARTTAAKKSAAKKTVAKKARVKKSPRRR